MLYPGESAFFLLLFEMNPADSSSSSLSSKFIRLFTPEFSSESSAWPLTKGKNPEIKKYQSMIYSKGRSLFHWRKANHLFRMQIMIDGKLLKFACIAVFSSAREAKKKKKK